MSGILTRVIHVPVKSMEPIGVWHRPDDAISLGVSGNLGTAGKPLERKHLANLHIYLGQIGGGQTGADQLVDKARLIARKHADWLAGDTGQIRVRDWDQVSWNKLPKHSLLVKELLGNWRLQVVEQRVVNDKPEDGLRTIYLNREAALALTNRMLTMAVLKERAEGPLQMWSERAEADPSPLGSRIAEFVQTINDRRRATAVEVWEQGQKAVRDARKKP